MVFLSYIHNFTANLALNKFIESKDYKSAAKIAKNSSKIISEDEDHTVFNSSTKFANTDQKCRSRNFLIN